MFDTTSGTAIKVLLLQPGSDGDEDGAGGRSSTEKKQREDDCDRLDEGSFVNRQEIIALINTLHQLSNSVGFASEVLRLSREGWADKAIIQKLAKAHPENSEAHPGEVKYEPLWFF